MPTQQEINQIKQMIHKSNQAAAEDADGADDSDADNAGLRGETTGEPDYGQEEMQEQAQELDAEAESETEGQVSVEEEQDATITPQELGEVIGWEASDVYNGLLVPLDDGQEPMPLADLKNQYQDQRRQIAELQAKVDQGPAPEMQQQAQMQQMSAEMMELNGYLQSLQRMEQATDWADLERTNPTEALLKRQKIRDARERTVQQIGELKRHEDGIRRDMLTKAGQKMIELIPAWKDDAARKTDQDGIRTQMQRHGFNDQEINGIIDPRHMSMLKEYIDMYNQLQAAKGAAKRVRKAPTLVRNSAGRFTSPNQQTLAQQAVKKAKETGNRNDQFLAAKAVIKAAAMAKNK